MYPQTTPRALPFIEGVESKTIEDILSYPFQGVILFYEAALYYIEGSSNS